MELFLKLAAAAVICAFFCSVLRRYAPDHALALGILGCCLCLLPLAGLVSSILDTMRQLRDLSGVEPFVFAPLLKMAAIGLLSQLAESACRESGEQTLAGAVSLCGTLASAYVCLPLITAVMDFLKELMMR